MQLKNNRQLLVLFSVAFTLLLGAAPEGRCGGMGDVILEQRAKIPRGWPMHADNFQAMGKAISDEPDFPRNGTDVEKTQYVFNKLPTLVDAYHLKAGSGGPIDSKVVSLYRLMEKIDTPFTRDEENAGSLKGFFHVGNCAEWTYAFSEMLGGAGVQSHPVVATKDLQGDSPEKGSFVDTDTTLWVEEIAPDGTRSRRVVDSFRAVYHAPGGKPTAKDLQAWGNRPLLDGDKLPQDRADISWLEQVEKPYVRDGGGKFERVPASLGKVDPRTLQLKAQLQKLHSWTGKFYDTATPTSLATITLSGNGISVVNDGHNSDSNHWTNNIPQMTVKGNVATGPYVCDYNDQDKKVHHTGILTLTLQDPDHISYSCECKATKFDWNPGRGPYGSDMHVGRVWTGTWARQK